MREYLIKPTVAWKGLERGARVRVRV